MEQADEVQRDIVHVQSIPIVDLSSSFDSQPGDHVMIIENVPESQENCSQNYMDNEASLTACDLGISVKEVEIKEDEIKEDGIKEDEIKEDEIKEDEIKEDEIKEVEIKEVGIKEDNVLKNVNANEIDTLNQEIITNNVQEVIKSNLSEEASDDKQEGDKQGTKSVVATEGKQEVVIESSEVKDNEKCAAEKQINKESMDVLTDDQEHNTEKENNAQNPKEDNVCIVEDTNTTDTDAQNQVLSKSPDQTVENKDQSLGGTDAETDLTKQVDSDSDVMVMTVESGTLDESIATVQGQISITDYAVLDKETKTDEIVNQEFDLIDYNQVPEETIIEVISTEVIHSEDPETSIKEGEKETSTHATPNIDPVTSPISEVTCKSGIVHNISINENKIEKKSNVVDQEEDIEQIEVQSSPETKTETCDSAKRNDAKEKHVNNEINIASSNVHNLREEATVNEVNKPISLSKKRSVLQDIFDDWGDENAEEDNQSISKEQDTVEIELKSLLDDPKTIPVVEEETIVIVKEEIAYIEKEVASGGKTVGTKENKEAKLSKEQSDNNQNANKQHSAVKSVKKESVNSKSQTPQTKSLVNRGRILSSQAEVTEALKERFREKQKLVEAPPGPDIFFVKKLTQRLSSKLGGSPIGTLPALIPLPQPTVASIDKTSIDNADSNKEISSEANKETGKESSSDNKELLAILEGDVDLDWSNLKPPTLTEEVKGPLDLEETVHNTPPKLDPLVERELALKQLLELPVYPVKKTPPRKKRTFKPAPAKVAKDAEEKSVLEAEKEIVSIDLANDSEELISMDTTPDIETSLVIFETTPEKNVESPGKEVRVDESRSGRKRKLTEKAREHEEQLSIVKRQKVYKSKVSVSKKQPQDVEVQPKEMQAEASPVVIENHESKQGNTTVDTIKVNDSPTTKVVNKELTNKPESISNKPEMIPVRRPKQNLSKKGPQSLPKRNIVVKKILKQNLTSGKKVALKAKLNTASKKSGSKVTSKSKQSVQSSSGDPKPKKKIINEIDRLLQDEGVVNLLYDVEQPDKKRLIPITKSQAKVMDIQKVQRELNFRKKLVRNAVLRLRTATTGVSKVSPRSKRTSIHMSEVQMEKKGGEQAVTGKSNAAAQQDFVLPGKIRNAADASIIIRRHSSSSFSSASGSPRVSVDSPDKVDGARNDEGGSHSLRSMKRRLSDEGAKKSKKKAVQRVDVEAMVMNNVDDKMLRPKKSDSKKGDKNSKQVDATLIEDAGSGKVITRSNGTTTGKVTSKTKKSAKNKVTFAKTSESDNNEEFSKGEDELSVCLAEAVSALSVVSAGNRSGSSTANRKSKVAANIAKILDLDNSKTKSEAKSQFSNKEINVRRHGNLVQLILTPSSSTKFKNALTLQMMQEFRDTLSILKRDDDCRVVLLTSTGSSFCEGLELSMLLHTNKEERRLRAQEMADAVKDFIKSLATFNKPIVAGVQGATIGLGVTMLPLFDLVIASDKATFSTPYGKLGQIAEGAAVFTLSHILGSAVTSELLLGGRTLTASEALRAGLVTRVLWPDRFQVELLPTLKAMSEQSSQSMEATKALLRHSLRKKLDAALESETYLLIQHWCSAECQTAMKAYIDGKVQ